MITIKKTTLSTILFAFLVSTQLSFSKKGGVSTGNNGGKSGSTTSPDVNAKITGANAKSTAHENAAQSAGAAVKAPVTGVKMGSFTAMQTRIRDLTDSSRVNGLSTVATLELLNSVRPTVEKLSPEAQAKVEAYLVETINDLPSSLKPKSEELAKTIALINETLASNDAAVIEGATIIAKAGDSQSNLDLLNAKNASGKASLATKAEVDKIITSIEAGTANLPSLAKTNPLATLKAAYTVNQKNLQSYSSAKANIAPNLSQEEYANLKLTNEAELIRLNKLIAGGIVDPKHLAQLRNDLAVLVQGGFGSQAAVLASLGCGP